jgi:hypothetical protein
MRPEPVLTTTEFAPPAGYVFEPELTGIAPRMIADRLADGPYARGRRSLLMRLFALGLCCFVLPYVPGVATLAYYLLFLQYLNWIGVAILLIACGSAVHYALRRGPFRYVRNGEPLVARVEGLTTVRAAVGHGLFAYQATLAYRHPETGAVVQTAVKSQDIAPLQQHRFAPRFQVGDYVTALYLPGKKVEKSLRLYAFLDLSPEVNIRQATTAESSLRAAITSVALLAFFFAMMGDLYAMKRYEPLELAWPQVAVAAALGGVLLAPLLFLLINRRSPGVRRGFFSTLFGALGALLLGSLTSTCWAFMLNAWLDRSPTETRPAQIVELWHTTYEGVFRSYEMEYRIQGSSESHRLLSTLGHLHEFKSRRAIARVRSGAFGWKWVEDVEPAPGR